MSNYSSNFTYQVLYDKALSYIINISGNCGGNYSSIDGWLKNANQKWTKSISGGGKGGKTNTITGTIDNSTRVVQVNETTIRNDFNNYIVNTKGFNLSEQVSTNKLYYFINCVIAFMETKMRVAGTDTIISGAKAVIYVTNYNSFPTVSFNTNPSNHPELIRADDVNSVLSIFKDTITRLIKPHVVKYTFT